MGKTTNKSGISTQISTELLERMRDAVMALSPIGLTVSGIVEEALERELTRLARKHGRGRQKWPPKRKVPVKTGRPLKSPG